MYRYLCVCVLLLRRRGRPKKLCRNTRSGADETLTRFFFFSRCVWDDTARLRAYNVSVSIANRFTTIDFVYGGGGGGGGAVGGQCTGRFPISLGLSFPT